MCFLLFVLLFLGQRYRLLSGLVLAVWDAFWLMAAAMQVVQRGRTTCSPASASCLLVFPACPFFKLRNYDGDQLPKGVREPKDINLCSWHVDKAEAFTNAVPCTVAAFVLGLW